jgi:hypothetical protein
VQSGKDYDAEDFDEDEEEEPKGKKDSLWSSESGEGSEEEKAPAQKKATDLRDEDIKWTQEKIDRKVKEMLAKRGTKV